MKNNAVGNRIMELCKKNELTVDALAVKYNVPPSTLKNIVYSQVVNAGVETIAKLCDGLGNIIQEFFQAMILNSTWR